MMRYFKQKCPVRFLSLLIKKISEARPHLTNQQEQNAKVRSRMSPTGPAKLSFRPNFQRQEPAQVPKRAKKPAQGDDDLDTAGPTFPTQDSGIGEQSMVRRSTRRAASRTNTSLVPMHRLSNEFELLNDEVESPNSSLSSEGNRHGLGGLAANLSINEQTMPTPRTRGETRQRELTADPDSYISAPSKNVRRMPTRYELPTEEPQGPGSLWTCEFRGCRFREYAADTAEGLERIRVHRQENHDGIEETVRDSRASQQPSAFGYV